MASYTFKELREMNIEKLIALLVIHSNSMTKTAKQTEEKIFMVLAERNVIDYEVMEKEYKRICMW